VLRLIIGRGANYPNIRVVEVLPFADTEGREGAERNAGPATVGKVRRNRPPPERLNGVRQA